MTSPVRGRCPAARWLPAAAALLLAVAGSAAFAHNIAGSDAVFVRGTAGPAMGPFLYLGAKHMVTGYDHLLFLFGVVFFLYRLKDVALYVTLFTVGHSVTLVTGVLAGWNVNAYLVDAVIGLSVVYKAFENLGGFRQVFGIEPDTRAAVLVFGLFHGLGLATRLQDMALSPDGLLTNLLSFNLGVEAGQLLALLFVVAALFRWRASQRFQGQAFAANAVLMFGGFLLMGYQLAGYLVEPSA